MPLSVQGKQRQRAAYPEGAHAAAMFTFIMPSHPPCNVIVNKKVDYPKNSQ